MASYANLVYYHGSRPKAEGFRWRECCERSELGGRRGCRIRECFGSLGIKRSVIDSISWQFSADQKSTKNALLPNPSKAHKSAPGAPKEALWPHVGRHLGSHLGLVSQPFLERVVLAKYARRLHGSSVFEAPASQNPYTLGSTFDSVCDTVSVAIQHLHLEPFLSTRFPK